MQPPTLVESDSLAAAGLLEDRSEFARSTGNHRGDPFQQRRALQRAARHYLEERGVPQAELDVLLPAAAPPEGWQGMPTTGGVKVFALLIEFQDYGHTNAADTINEALFGAPAGGAPYESLAAYYRRASYDQLHIGGVTLGWYKTNKKRSAVTPSSAGREALIKEAIQHFKAEGHDFSQYDNDGDGTVDYFLVLWPGPDTGWATFWWGYQTRFSDPWFKVDGVRLGKYSWQWEARPVGAAFSPKVCIHETGHALGLPDLYDYDGAVGPDGGVGGADMMDGNWLDHNCYSKWMLDWLTPMIIGNGCHAVMLNPSGTSKDCVAVWPGLDAGDIFSELYMVQNRQKAGNDVGLPAPGLVIWHVDATLDASGADFMFDNSYTVHKYVRLMEADGLEEIEANGGFDAGDLYTPGRTLGPGSRPSSARYDGSDSFVEVRDIAVSGAAMSATICGTRAVPKIKVPSTVYFGTAVIERIHWRTVSILNEGTAPLACSISPGSSPGFSCTLGTCGSFAPTIAPGSLCSLRVRFIPLHVGDHLGSIVITSNDPDAPVKTIQLKGKGKEGPGP